MEDVLQCPALLVPFHLLCYANLKKYVFDHHFSFPTLPSKWTVIHNEQAPSSLVKTTEAYIAGAPPEQRGYFLIDLAGTVKPLSSLTQTQNVASFLYCR